MSFIVNPVVPPTNTNTNPTSINQLLNGGGVAWTGLLNFTVGAASYLINSTTFSSPQTNLTLAAADPTNPRIDVIAVNTSGAVVVITGTPAANPQAPSVDPTSQLALTFVLVPANSTTPGNITTTNIYLENTEWTMARSPTTDPPWNLASTNNPLSGTKCIEATSAGNGNFITATKPAAGTENLTNYNNLVLNIRNKAAWPGSKSLSLFWLNGSTILGNSVTIKNGTYNFNNGNITSYQQITIPTSDFAVGSNLVTTLKIQVVGGGSAIGFYLDNIFLQGGTAQVTTPTNAMLFQGAWSSTQTYSPRDVVTNNGATYIALVANTGVTPVNGSTWLSLSSAGESYHPFLQIS